MHIIITGNPVDGMTFHGPFESEDAALAFGESARFSDAWWIADLVEPDAQH